MSREVAQSIEDIFSTDDLVKPMLGGHDLSTTATNDDSWLENYDLPEFGIRGGNIYYDDNGIAYDINGGDIESIASFTTSTDDLDITIGAYDDTIGAPDDTIGAPDDTIGAPDDTIGAPDDTIGAYEMSNLDDIEEGFSIVEEINPTSQDESITHGGNDHDVITYGGNNRKVIAFIEQIRD